MIIRISVLSICLLIITNCSSNNQKAQGNLANDGQSSLDWAAHYRGVLPCASCPGIDTEIKLYQDSTYVISRRYKGENGSVMKDFGRFSWSENGENIILEHESDSSQNQAYKVGENGLTHLDQNGEEIEGELAEHYFLKKIPFSQSISGKYWKLIELRGQKVTADLGQRRDIHITLTANSTTFLGFGGCNPIMGTYNTEAGNRIKFSKIAVTLRACKIQDFEKTFLNTLEEADNYAIKNDTLSLNKARMAPMAKFEAVYLY